MILQLDDQRLKRSKMWDFSVFFHSPAGVPNFIKFFDGYFCFCLEVSVSKKNDPAKDCELVTNFIGRKSRV
jgi:hypothetical protein